MEALRAKLATAEEELSAQNVDRDAKLRRLTSTVDRPSSRLQEDFVPHVQRRRCAMDGRSPSRHSGRDRCRQCTRGGKVVPGHGICSHRLVNSNNDTFDGVQHSPVIDLWRVVRHQCGFQGCRVGEASNPGPVQTRQARRLERLIPCTQVDVSSDEEVLVRRNSGRHVVPRTVGELPATVLASPGTLVMAGLLPEHDNTQRSLRMGSTPATAGGARDDGPSIAFGISCWWHGS